MTPINIKKLSGAQEEFSETKLINSLKRSGIDDQNADRILKKVTSKLYPGMSTKEIYKLAFNSLKKSSKNYSATYSLKKAILSLGPSGFHFEKFVCSIFKESGYQTEIGKIFKGKCIKHEVDVVAKDDRHTLFMECKFHNTSTKKNDIKTALYVNARQIDLRESTNAPDFDDFYLISNTSFSKDAIEYSACAGLKLIGLNTPESQSLHDLIRSSRLHPITCLKKLKVRDKNKLLDRDIILCKDLWENQHELDQLGISQNEKKAVLTEIRNILVFTT